MLLPGEKLALECLMVG